MDNNLRNAQGITVEDLRATDGDAKGVVDVAMSCGDSPAGRDERAGADEGAAEDEGGHVGLEGSVRDVSADDSRSGGGVSGSYERSERRDEAVEERTGRLCREDYGTLAGLALERELDCRVAIVGLLRRSQDDGNVAVVLDGESAALK